MLQSEFVPRWNAKFRKAQWCQVSDRFYLQNKSHGQFLTKNHVLVCHEHRQNNENQELLQENKEKCILKHIQLSIFSRDLKLIFSWKLTTAWKSLSASSRKLESYILQTIRVDKEPYFFIWWHWLLQHGVQIWCSKMELAIPRQSQVMKYFNMVPSVQWFRCSI